MATAIRRNPIEAADSRSLVASRNPGAIRDPAASRSIGASRNPAANGNPGASWNPTANRNPGASRNPTANRNPSASRNPAASWDPGAQRHPGSPGRTAFGVTRTSLPSGERTRPGPVLAVLLTALVRLVPTGGSGAGPTLVLGHEPRLAPLLMNSLWKTLRLS